MDILRKMFGKNRDDKDQETSKDEFRKPTWYEENETDDELFDGDRKFMFQIFTNPIELQKHFEHQMQEILKSMNDLEANGEVIERDLKDEYLKPGFEENFIKEYKEHQKVLDTDLDGEIYADQLHSLLQRLSPDVKQVLPEKEKKAKVLQPKKKLTDEETIMGKIHGTIEEEPPVVRRKGVIVPKISPHFGGVFEGTYQGPKMFGQSVMTQTIRKPDGTYETKKTVRDTDGNIKTTITRTINGKSETFTTYGKGNEKSGSIENSENVDENSLASDRNIFVSKYGYALPKNLW